MSQDHAYAKKAHELGRMLVAHKISVVTGGGSGIMEAANCGAFESKEPKIYSLGISVRGLNDSYHNACTDEIVVVDQLFARKWLLARYALAFVVFPGGYGTADELFEILTLMQTGYLQRIPVVLIGVDYWKDLLSWVKRAEQEKLLFTCDAELIFVTDDVRDAFEHIQRQSERI